jgi:hypothetical protein
LYLGGFVSISVSSVDVGFGFIFSAAWLLAATKTENLQNRRYAADSKSADLRVFGGSTPPPGTIILVAFSITYVFNCIERIAMARWRKIPTVAALQFSNDTRTTDVLVTGL